jgi:hypothetical protein
MSKRERKTTPLRLGGQEYGRADVARDDARGEFFSAMAEVHPNFLRSLYNEPFRRWKASGKINRQYHARRFADVKTFVKWEEAKATVRSQAAKEAADRGDAREAKEFRDWAAKAARCTEPARRFCQSLEDWARRWNLFDTWCLDLAFLQILTPGRRRAGLGWHLGGGDRFRDVEPLSAPLPFRAWEPTVQTRPGYEADMRRAFRKLRRPAFDQLLAEYCDDVERRATKAGLVKLPTKREPIHYRWLARFQVGEDFEAIAQDSGDSVARSEAAIERAVRRTAKFIGLTLRKLPRRGRPRGVREVHYRAPRTPKK